MMQIPFYVNKILHKLHTSGYEAFVVGGCVRDALMGVAPCDWDICTSALPNQVIDLFKEKHTVIPTGLQHGTVTIISEGNQIEVTTYRSDGEYDDNRHPEKVVFLPSVEGDLARRDFTMNSIAYNPKDGLIDLFGGIADIHNKTIRCVGNPEKRFEEDALRIMRALRFAAVCGFEIEEETETAVFEKKDLLKNISAERILSEFKKLILADKPSRIIIKYKEVFKVRIPIANQNENIIIIDNMPKDIVLRITSILSELSYDDAQRVLKNLKSDNEMIKSVCSVLNAKDIPIPQTKIEVKHILNKLGCRSAKNLFSYWQAKGIKTNHILKFLDEIESNSECYTLDMMNLNGSDLIELGFEKGKAIGTILNRLLQKVINEELENKKAALVEAAKSLL